MANRGGKGRNSIRFPFLGGSKITAGGDCPHKVRRCLLLGRKAMTNLKCVLKSRDITLLTKVHTVKAMARYRCESWTVKKAETEELMPSNHGAGEDSREFLGQQGDPMSQSERKSTLNIHWKD